MSFRHFRKRAGLTPIVLLAIAASVTVYAQETPLPAGARVVETGILQNLSGFTGDVLGAEVIAVTPEADGTQVIDIVIPVNPDEVDQVRVLTPDGRPLKQQKQVEFIRDHENGEVGIILKLPKKDRLGFKFKLIDLPDE